MPDPVNNHDIRKLLLSYPRRAIRILCDNYYKSLLKIAYNLTHDRDAAKDIVQDTFAYVWQNSRELGNYQERSIQHYLVRIVRNKSMTYYNENVTLGKRKIRLMNGQSFGLAEQSIEDRIIQVEITQEILDIIARFPKRERECLMMKIEEELHNEEIASRLGVGIKMVEKSLTSAKKRLREHLQLKSQKKIRS
ncbi:MAG: RNA polymerase sigma factor [Bacteroidota bacterium]